MADDTLGLSRIRGENPDIFTGPTPEEIRGRAPGAGVELNADGLDLGRVASATLGALGTAKDVVGDVAAGAINFPVDIAIRGLGGPSREERAEKREIQIQNARSKIRERNANTRLINVTAGTEMHAAIAPIAQGLQRIPESQREAELQRIKADVIQDFGEVGGLLLETLTDNETASALPDGKSLEFMMQHNPKFAAAMLATNMDTSKFTPQQMGEFAFDATSNAGKAAAEKPETRKSWGEIQRTFKSKHPARFSEFSKSDGGFDVSEALIMLEATHGDILDLQAPDDLSVMRDAITFGWMRLGLTSAEDVQALRLEDRKKQIDARHRQPVQPKNAVNIVTPSGESFLSFDGGRTVRTAQGDIATPTQSRIVGQQATGTPGELGLVAGASEFQKLREIEIATRGFIDLSRQTQDLFLNRPEVLGTPGALANLGERFAATARGFSNLLDLRFELEGEEVSADEFEIGAARNFSKEIDAATEALQRPGIDSARVRSAVVGLAFAAAASAGQTGRGVSDRDYRAFLLRVGESSSDRAFAAVLQDVERELIRNFETSFDVLTRDIPEDQRPQRPDLSIGISGEATSPGPARAARARQGRRPLVVEEIP